MLKEVQWTLFKVRGASLTFRHLAVGGELTNWKKAEVLLYLRRKRIQSG